MPIHLSGNGVNQESTIKERNICLGTSTIYH
jgi:hypothetical protein